MLDKLGPPDDRAPDAEGTIYLVPKDRGLRLKLGEAPSYRILEIDLDPK